MENKDPLELLKHIERIDPPPFLYTQIDNAIRERDNHTYSGGRILAYASAFALLLAINTWFIQVSSSQPVMATETETVSDAMYLNTSEQLYYE